MLRCISIQQLVHRFACRRNFVGSRAHIDVHGGLNVCMACNGLQGFEVNAFSCQHGQVGVAEDMCRCAVEIDKFLSLRHKENDDCVGQDHP